MSALRAKGYAIRKILRQKFKSHTKRAAVAFKLE